MTQPVETEAAARIELFDQLLLCWLKENRLLGEEEQEALRRLSQTVDIVRWATGRGSYPDNMPYIFDDPSERRLSS